MEFYQSIWTGTFCYNARTTLYRDGFVEGSRWTTVINSSDITRPTAVQALITGHDAVRTKYVHQVTACCLDIFMHEAFQQRNITDTKIKTLRLNIGH